ncbi:MAG TPA: hypothetical protein ENK84_05855 [Desulfobulbus sp.]|nr:hypothetical protein [Desulfobulbus sp.]
MLEHIYFTINSWISSGGLFVAAFGCFTWGMVSVLFSPCHMASIPLIIGYVGGQDAILGLAYGILSGSCTFGFIAPILAIITVQEKIATGLLLLTLFALGHCTPIVIAGSSAATVKKMITNSSFQHGGAVFRKGAGIVIGFLGMYFIARPWLSA